MNKEKFRKDLELTTSWNSKDRRDVMLHNRELWERTKNEAGCSQTDDLEKKFPGFTESLRILQIEQGYSVTDIGVIFGLTTERIRQHMGLFKPKREGHAMHRIWDDFQNRFVPISKEELELRVEKAYEVNKKKELEKKLDEKRKYHVEIILNFAKKHKRAPNLKELTERAGYKIPEIGIVSLAHYWGHRGRRKIGENVDSSISYQDALDNLYRAAGFQERPGKGGKIRRF